MSISVRKATAEAIMAEPALVLDNVHAGYGETVVLEDIRFNLGASETVSIIGRNGVGIRHPRQNHAPALVRTSRRSRPTGG